MTFSISDKAVAGTVCTDGGWRATDTDVGWPSVACLISQVLSVLFKPDVSDRLEVLNRGLFMNFSAGFFFFFCSYRFCLDGHSGLVALCLPLCCNFVLVLRHLLFAVELFSGGAVLNRSQDAIKMLCIRPMLGSAVSLCIQSTKGRQDFAKDAVVLIIIIASTDTETNLLQHYALHNILYIIVV